LKNGIGDLFVIFRIVIPKDSNEELNTLWQSLSDISDFNPRAEWETQNV
jgi:curved DNA-binding protein